MPRAQLNIAFAVEEVTALKYFTPLIEKALERDHKVTIFYNQTVKKPTGPTQNDNLKHLARWQDHLRPHQGAKQLANFLQELQSDILVTLEGAPFLNEPKAAFHRTWKHLTLPALTDYVDCAPLYLPITDYFCSFGPMTDNYLNYPKSVQVLHLGSPKYDCLKPRLSQSKNLLIFAPNKGQILSSSLIFLSLILIARMKGYTVHIKTRPKHNSLILKFFALLSKAQVILEENYYPSTSLELLEKCQLCVTFDSTTFKEALMIKRPLINFNLKPYRHKRPVLDAFFNQSDLEDFGMWDFKPGTWSVRSLSTLFDLTSKRSMSDKIKLLAKRWIDLPPQSSQLLLNFMEKQKASQPTEVLKS